MMMRKETRRFVSIHSFCRRCALGNDRKRVPLSLCLLSRALQKKSRASSRFQQMHLLLLATSFHHRAVVCFSTVSLAFPRDDDDDDERREMMAPRRSTKERKKEASESFFFPLFGREKKGQFWCQISFFPLDFFFWWSVVFLSGMEPKRESYFLLGKVYSYFLIMNTDNIF